MYFLIYVACGLYLWLLGVRFSAVVRRGDRSFIPPGWLRCLDRVPADSAPFHGDESDYFLGFPGGCFALRRLMVAIRLRRGFWQGGGARRLSPARFI